jgi:hypothetical protein
VRVEIFMPITNLHLICHSSLWVYTVRPEYDWYYPPRGWVVSCCIAKFARKHLTKSFTIRTLCIQPASMAHGTKVGGVG